MRLLRVALLLMAALAPSVAQAAEGIPLRAAVPTYGPVPSAGVHVVGGRGSFLYVVQGAPQVVRGMGYNAPLSALPMAERLPRLQRDFALMRRVGVNTVLGWDQGGFDRALLDVAQANGIGVVMHFDLGKDWDYANPDLRARLLAEIAAWVDRYKDHPAVRMWGVGNEVMLGMDAEECRVFAELYVQIYELVREHDAGHPVVYREAEDVRVPFFRDAFKAAGVAPREFVFGMNFYTPRMLDSLANFDEMGLDVPVLISEFAPAGLPPAQRAAVFHDLWMKLRPHERFVLGAAPYAWATDGPEAVDRLFGLTDGQGRPVDGALSELQKLYRGGIPFGELLPSPAPPTRAVLGMALDSALAQALARALSQSELDPIDLEAVRAQATVRYTSELAAVPNAARADRKVMARMLDLLIGTTMLAALRQGGDPVYPGAVEALPLVSGMGRWAATDPGAQPVAEAFLTEVVTQALRLPIGVAPVPD